MKSVSSLPAAERPVAGAALNRTKTELEAALAERERTLREASLAKSLGAGAVDLTLPGRPIRLGRMHPISRTIREISRSFPSMGFAPAEAPQISRHHLHFEALTIPAGHL